jgi:integrase
MPRSLPQYVYAERNRHGTVVFYFRKSKGARTRLPAPNHADFDDAYHELLASLPVKNASHRGATGTLEWLIARYQQSAAYHHLAPATRKQRDNIFAGVIAKGATRNLAGITSVSIIKGLNDRAATPAQARHFLHSMRGLFKWALEAGQITTDPTKGVMKPAEHTGDGFPAWTDADVAAYEARWPQGTHQRVWMHVLLYTGLRRGDAVALGRQHVKHDVATLKTEKTGTEVSIPLRTALAETLAAGPTGDLAFIVGEKRRPLTKESFGNMFRDACQAAGVNKSAHGLRKLAASRAAEAGATVNELEAWFGWEGGAMASHYTRKADRRRLAQAVADKMEDRSANAIRPHLVNGRPAPMKKR